MAIRYWPFNSIDGDRLHGAEAPARLVRFMFRSNGTGIIPNDKDLHGSDGDTSLKVVATSPVSMTVEVTEGQTFVFGRYAQVFSNPTSIVLDTADASNDRIDRVVARLEIDGERNVSIYVLTGTPGAAPVAPALTRTADENDDAGVYEISLAQVYVATAVTSVSDDEITDERTDNAVCGFLDTPDFAAHGNDSHEEDVRKVSFYGPQLISEGSLDLSSWDSNPKNLKFSPDGLVMYLVGGTSAAIFQFDLAVAWDATTATLDGSFDVSAEEGQPAGLMFKPDGTVMYVTGAWSDSVDQYNLSTAWDVTTAVTNGSLSVAAEETSPSGLNFNADGSRLFVIGTSSDKIWTYLLSTAWDITTGSVSGGGFVLTSQNTVPKNLEFSPDGYKAYVADGRKIFEYSLKTAYGVGTGGGDYYGTIYSVEDDTTSVGGGTFGNDGKRLYVTTFSEKLLLQFDLTQ